MKLEFGERNWWQHGVPTQVQIDCTTESIKGGHKHEPYEYLSVSGYKAIIVKNWKLFSSKESIEKTHPDGYYFSSPKYDGKKGWRIGKDKKLEWYSDKYRRIRNKVAHEGSREDPVTEKELEFLQSTYNWLSSKLSKL
ncbi:MAG: hypothetical protein ACE5DP_04235 [Fidelibacterota bacterium]